MTKYAIGKPPKTADEWASEILAGDTSLGCAAPDDIYRPKHKRLVDDIRAIQRQAQREKIDLYAEFELIGDAEQALSVVADYLDTKRGHEVAQGGLESLAELRKRLLPRAKRTPEEIAAGRRVRRAKQDG